MLSETNHLSILKRRKIVHGYLKMTMARGYSDLSLRKAGLFDSVAEKNKNTKTNKQNNKQKKTHKHTK